MSLQIYDPTTEVKSRSINFVPRQKSLKGLGIGLVDKTKQNSDQLLMRIAVPGGVSYGVGEHENREWSHRVKDNRA